MNILEEIAAYAHRRVAEDKNQIPLEMLKEGLCPSKAGMDFASALKRPGLSVICEVKRASPSKGLIAPDFPYVTIATEYATAGADCISCLTEPKWFLGSDKIFREIRQTVSTPMLRKDFTIDEYQIYQSAALGANAVLLICALLDTATIARYLEITCELGLTALVEAHNQAEIASALSAGAEIIGVNNRNLKDFSVDFTNAQRLREAIPPHVIYVAESGVSSPEDAGALYHAGADAVLVGEALMRAPDKTMLLQQIREAAE